LSLLQYRTISARSREVSFVPQGERFFRPAEFCACWALVATKESRAPRQQMLKFSHGQAQSLSQGAKFGKRKKLPIRRFAPVTVL
jgi:hypothetical protein